jgi:hypothetical protein
MGLPAQIQAQLDAADELHKQMFQQPAENAEEGDEPPESSEAQSAPEATQPEPTVAPKESEFAQLEQRYKSLQGMWQSANARLQKAEAQNSELAEKLQEAIERLNATSSANTSEPSTSQLVTDKDAEAFGTDLIDLARRIAKEQFGEREKLLIGKIEDLTQRLTAQDQRLGNVAQTQAQTAQERFYATLDSQLSTWEAIQATPECQQWLQTRVPGTRATWNDALLTAAEEVDAARALEVFEAFLSANPQMDPRKKPAPEPSKKAELQRQVAPSKSAAATATPQGKRVYSAAEFAAEMDRVVRMGKARQYDDSAALENELNAALAEGRVTP